MESLRKIIGSNLAELRKERKITQLELAEMFGYTDKAISKREKGDTLPDVETLYQLASFYGVTIDYLTNDIPLEEKEIITNPTKQTNIKANRISIVLLSISLVWMLATICFVWIMVFNSVNYYQVFIYAIPLTAIVLILFNKTWGERKYNFYIYTLFLWSLISSIYVGFLQYNLWPLFLLGVPSQILIFLWSRMKDGFLQTIKSTKSKNK
ncbi:MAG: helix-turn-helix transcriptional regulator [Candidatus Onthovivens sp.]|nr:helix-turn-helix domain-containing protein [Mollicutes bacterium]MDY4857148.1 helix-turn-helix transcriptional regulator [Candidatus Onthovivens sp.]MDY4936649.1 helix-turn-helix transcriptional regulator [Candidatus Onthovivens sp.]